MTKNLLGKRRNVEKPYAIWKGQGPFGNTELCLLKTYQTPSNENKNKFAKWMVAVKTDMTHGSYDIGDNYCFTCLHGLKLSYADPLFKEQYWDGPWNINIDNINNINALGE